MFMFLSTAGVIIIAASGGGGEDNNGSAPVISNLALNTTSIVIGVGDQFILGSMDFEDDDGNISTMTISVFDSNDELIDTNTGGIEGISGEKTGTIYIEGSLDPSYLIFGIYKIEIYLTDETNLKSNVLERNIIISAGIAPTISNLTCSSISSGDYETMAIFVSTSFTDDGNVSTITAEIYDSGHNQVGASTLPIEGANSYNMSGFIEEEFDFDILETGNYTLEVYVTDKANLNSNVLSGAFIIDGGFQPRTFYIEMGNTPGDNATGDLNGDSLNDIAYISLYSLKIFYQNISGGLDDPVTIDLDISIRSIAISDVNNDTKSDLILSGISLTSSEDYSGRILVIIQNPESGELESPIEYIVHSDKIGKIAIADLNEDNKNDIVVIREEGPALFFQDSDGGLSTETDVSIPSFIFNQDACEVQIADINDDGKNDIVAQSGPKEIAVVAQISDGIFVISPYLYTVQTRDSERIHTFALGDLNGDDLTDMVTVDPSYEGYINIFLQNSQGTFDDPVLIDQSYWDTPYGVEVADITYDGLNDIVMDNYSGLILMAQSSENNFSTSARRTYSHSTYSSGGFNNYRGLSIEDVTGDGYVDAVSTWIDGLYVYPGTISEIIFQ